jgi:hypothetical protein
VTSTIDMYVDGIIIHVTTFEENEQWTSQMLNRLREHRLCSKPAKCTFAIQEIIFLGMVVGNGQVRMSDEKRSKVVTWTAPCNKRKLQRFLGFTNAYRCFIKGYAGIAHPLYKLTANAPWAWNDKHQLTFDRLRTVVSTEEVLVLPVSGRKLQLEMDTSEWASGAVLSQEQEDSNFQPVVFESKIFKTYELNYDTYDKELLEIMWALEEWCSLLLGSDQLFEFLTDHHNLIYYKYPCKLTKQQAHWSAILQDYDFVIKHIIGKVNKLADALLRWEDEPTIETWEESMFKEGMWKAIQYTEDEKVSTMQQNHDDLLTGHSGIDKTLKKVQWSGHWWKGMRNFVANYVKGCEACQHAKPWKGLPPGHLTPLPMPMSPWKEMT